MYERREKYPHSQYQPSFLLWNNNKTKHQNFKNKSQLQICDLLIGFIRKSNANIDLEYFCLQKENILANLE